MFCCCDQDNPVKFSVVLQIYITYSGAEFDADYLHLRFIMQLFILENVWKYSNSSAYFVFVLGLPSPWFNDFYICFCIWFLYIMLYLQYTHLSWNAASTIISGKWWFLLLDLNWAHNVDVEACCSCSVLIWRQVNAKHKRLQITCFIMLWIRR